MRILITGAAGFLGSHLTRKMLSAGNKVIGLDDFSTGSPKNLPVSSDFEFIEHDVRVPFEADVDAILNFACPASPKNYQLDPVRTIETNFIGTMNMLKLAKSSNAILVQASTSEIYGDPQISPQVESYWGNVNPIGIRSCYDEGKRAAETLCFDFKRQHQVDARVIRIFNTYGPNMAVGDGRVVSNFIVQALLNEPITIYGDGSQTRSFCYATDLVEGIGKVLSHATPISTPINLGNPTEFTMMELAKLIIEVTNSKSEIVFNPLPQDDPQVRQPDISKAQVTLDWNPTISLRQGIHLTASYFMTELGI